MNPSTGNFWINAPIQAAAGFVVLGQLGAIYGLVIAIASWWWARYHRRLYLLSYPSRWAENHTPRRSDQFVYSIAGWILTALAILISGPLWGFAGMAVLFGCTFAGRPIFWKIARAKALHYFTSGGVDIVPGPAVALDTSDHGFAFGDASVATPDEAKNYGLGEGDNGGFWVGHGLSYLGPLGAVILGASGCGKFVFAICITLLTCRDSAFVYDPKGQITAVTMAWRKLIGQIVQVMNPFGVWPRILGASVSYNVLADLEYPDKFFESIVEQICLILIPFNPEEKTQHFSNGARALVGALIMHVRITMGKDGTLCHVNDLLQRSPAKLDAIFVEMMKSPVSTVRQVADWFHSELTLESTRDIFTTAKNNMKFLSDTVIREWFAPSDFSFKNFKKHKSRTLYFVVPSHDAETYPKAIQLVLTMGTNALIRPPHRSVIGIFDEVATSMPKGQGGGSCPDIIRRSYALARENGFKLQTIFQDFKQMQNFFKCGDAELQDSVLGNCGMIQVFGAGPGDLTTAKWACEQLGETTIWTPTRESLWDEPPADLYPRKRIADAFEPAGGSAAGVPLRRPNDIRAMVSNGEQIVLLSGMKNALITTRRPEYFNIPTIRDRSSFDPHHEREEWKQNSAAASAKEYCKLLPHASPLPHQTACGACSGTVRAVPLNIADWDGESIGICETCRQQVVFDAGSWVWKIRMEGGLQYGVTWKN